MFLTIDTKKKLKHFNFSFRSLEMFHILSSKVHVMLYVNLVFITFILKNSFNLLSLV